jgi:amino acid transporter
VSSGSQTAIFVLVHNVSAACFTLVDMAAALYLIMYMFMFAPAILLRRNKLDVHRSYRVPAMTTVAVIGFLALLAAFSLGEPRGPWKRGRAR